MRNIYTSLDIGTNSCKLLVAEVYKDKLNVLCTSEERCIGIKKGLIVNAEETLATIKKLLQEAEDMLSIKIAKVIVSIPLYNVEFVKGEGYITVTREEKIFNGEDIVKSLQASAYNRIPDDRELVSIMPLEFVIDDEDKIMDPKGQHGSKLSVTSVMGMTPKKNVYSVITLLESLGLTVVDITFNPIADYYAFEKEDYNKVTGAIVNLGRDKTEVSIMHKGVLINSEIIPIGGRDIDKMIAYEYNITSSDAKILKETFGYASLTNASMSDTEMLVDKEGKEIKINQYELSEIMHERLKEMLELAKKQINLLTKQQISYIIITGGLTETRDFKLVYEEVFGKGIIPSGLTEIGVRDNKYSVCVGMIKYYYSKLKFRNKVSSMLTEEDEIELVNTKKKDNNVVGKIIEYFFDN